MSEDLRYNAFISYRHCEPDKTIAKALHRKLENYHIPKELREKLGRNVLGRVFRDEAELPVTDSLSDAILDALRQSEYLIVICSPRLKDSAWCMKEIEIFTRLHGKKKILPVLIEGEPEDSFPESLFYEDITEKDPEGNEVTVRVDKEPLAADCRGGHKGLQDSVIKLSAAMLGLNYDDLKQRHRVEKLKRRTFFSGVIFAVVFLFLLQSIYFLGTIQQQKAEIERKYADSIANTAAELLKAGDRMAALYAARSVLPDEDGEGVCNDAFRVLVDAAHIYSRDGYVPEKLIAESSLYGTVTFSPQCEWVVIDDAYGNILIDTVTGENVYRFNSLSGQTGFYKNEGLAYSEDGKSYYYNIDQGKKTVLLDEESQIFSPPSGEMVILLTHTGVYGFKGSEQVYYKDLKAMGVDFAQNNYVECYYSLDEKYCLMRIRAFHSEDYSPEWILQTDLMSGDIMVFLSEKDTERLFGEECDMMDMDTDGQKLYMLAEKMDGTWERQLYCYDIRKKTITDSVNLGKENFTDLYHIDSKLLIMSNDRVVIYDEGLEYIVSFGVPKIPKEVLYVDGRAVVINEAGELYSIDEIDAGLEITDEIFEEVPQWDVETLKWSGDKIYVKFAGKEGIVIYSKATGEAYKKYEGEYDLALSITEDSAQEKASEFFGGMEGFDREHYMSGSISSDGRYYIGCFDDGTAVIYDAVTGEKVDTLYDVITYVYCFEYLERYDCYAITTGNLEIFDVNFGHMITIDDIWGVDTDREGRVFACATDGECYELDLMDYGETIEYADKLLEGYTPSQRLCEKYGL